MLLVRSQRPDGATLKLCGEIKTPGQLCDVIALAAQSTWTGELVVLTESHQRTIFLENGMLVGALTNVPEERLGEMLYRFGVVTREQLDAALKSSTESGKRLGEAAIDLDFVSAEELYPMMARQVEEVFYGATQATGVFYFFDKFDEKTLGRRHNLNAAGLLMEAARRMDEMRYFRDKVPSDVYLPTPTHSGKPIPDELAEVYHNCDGKRTVADVGRRVGMLEFEATRAIFQLINGGLIHMVAPRPHGPGAIMEAFNPALVAIHKFCDAAGRGGELRDGLGRFAMGAGIYEPLFMGAGPLGDGSLKPAGVARNLAALAGEDPDSWLTQQLHEYVGFALFQAGSLLPRDSEGALTREVAELLKPVRPTAETSAPAPVHVSTSQAASAPPRAQAIGEDSKWPRK